MGGAADLGGDQLPDLVGEALVAIQDGMLATAKRMLADHTAEVESFDELAARVVANAGWSLVRWCGNAACEARIKAGTKATIRCLPHDAASERGRCLVCGGPSDQRMVVARAY